MSDQVDNRARQGSIGGSGPAGPVNGGMPTPGASAAMRLVREILARLNSPHAGGASRPLSPASLWRQVSRRLGYTTEQPQGTHFGQVPHVDVVHRLHTVHAQGAEDDGWQAPVWPARRPPINVVGQPVPVPLPVPLPTPAPLPLPVAQPPQTPVMPPEARQANVTPDTTTTPEVVSAPVPAPTSAALEAGTQDVAPAAPAVESGPPVFVPARAIRIEYVPGPAITPPQPLVAPAPSLARPSIATSFTPSPVPAPAPRAQVAVARMAMPGVETAPTDVSAPAPAFRSREISQPAEQPVVGLGLAEQSPRLDMPLKARPAIRGAEESSEAYSSGYESTRSEYRPRPAIVPQQPLVSAPTLADRAAGLQVTPPERSLASNVSHDLVPTADLLSRMESARAAEIMPAPVPVPAQPQQAQPLSQTQAAQQMPEQPPQVVEQPAQPQVRQTLSTPVPAMPQPETPFQPALQMPLAVAPDTRISQAARPADQTFASPEVEQRGPVAGFLGRVLSALPLPDALRRALEPAAPAVPETTQPTEAQTAPQAPIQVQAEVAPSPEVPAVSVPATPVISAAASPSPANVEQPAVPVPQSPVVSQQPLVAQAPGITGQTSAVQAQAPTSQVQQVAIAPSVPVSGQVSAPGDVAMPATTAGAEEVAAVVPATPVTSPAIEAASSPVVVAAGESAPAPRASQGLFGTILSRLLGTSASRREDASPPAQSSGPSAVPRTWARPNNRQAAAEDQQFGEQSETPRATFGQGPARPPQTVTQTQPQAQPPVQTQEQIVAPAPQEVLAQVAQVAEDTQVAQTPVGQEQAVSAQVVAGPVETPAPVVQVEQPVSYATQQLEQASQETVLAQPNVVSGGQPGVEAVGQGAYSQPVEQAQPSITPPIAPVLPGVEMPRTIAQSGGAEVGETLSVPVAPVAAEVMIPVPVRQVGDAGQANLEQDGTYSAAVESAAPVTAQPLASRPQTPSRRGLFGTLLARLLGRGGEEAGATPQESHPSIPLEWARPARLQDSGEAEGFAGQAQAPYTGATRPTQAQGTQGVQSAPTIAQQPPVAAQAEAQAQAQAQVAAYEAQVQAQTQAQAAVPSTEPLVETPAVRVELPQVSEVGYQQAATVVPASPAEDAAVTSQGVVAGMAAEATRGQQVEQTAQAGEQAAAMQAQSAAQLVEAQPSPVAPQEGTPGQGWEGAPASSDYTGEAWIILADMAEDVAGTHTPLSSVEPIGMRGGLLARVLGGLGRAFRVAESSAAGSLDAVWRATPVFRNIRGMEGAGSETGAALTAGYRASGASAPLPAVQTKFGGTLPASAASRAGSGDFAPGAAASDGTPGLSLSGLGYPASAEGGAIGHAQAPLSPFIGQAQAGFSPLSASLSSLPLSMTYATLASTGSYRGDVPLSGPQAPVSYLGTGRRPSVVMRSPGQMSPVVDSYLQAEQPADGTDSETEAVSDGVTSWAEILRKIYGLDAGQSAQGEMPLAVPYDGFVVPSDGEMASPFSMDGEWLGSEPPYSVPGYPGAASPAAASVAAPISMPLPRPASTYISSPGMETTRSYTWTVPGWSADNGSNDSEAGAWADVVSSAVQGGYGSDNSQGATAPALAMSPNERGPAPDSPEHPNLEDSGDIDSLAESVYAIIRHRIEMERERNG